MRPAVRNSVTRVTSNSRLVSTVPNPMYMLAFDHRQVLRDLYPGVSTEDLKATKTVVLDALDLLSQEVADKGSLAFLVDEEYGAAAAQEARRRGFYVASPIEASRTKVLQLQYPDDYRARFGRLDPQCVKALVFHNPADPPERKAAQLGLLREIAGFAREQARDYLLEVLITPTHEQLERAGGKAGFRANLFPELLVESIAEMQEAGIDPDVWKVQGLETVEATAAVGNQATSSGRHDVRCIVLGSGESQDTVNRWLVNASTVSTFSGLAVGRTVWREPLADMLAGRVSREETLEAIAHSFKRLIEAFGREPTAIHMDA